MPLSSSLATEPTTTQPDTANNEMQVDVIRPKASASFPTDTPIESASGAASKNGDEQLQWKPNSREWLTLLCLGIVSMVVALDTNILVPVLPVRPKSPISNLHIDLPRQLLEVCPGTPPIPFGQEPRTFSRVPSFNPSLFRYLTSSDAVNFYSRLFLSSQ